MSHGIALVQTGLHEPLAAFGFGGTPMFLLLYAPDIAITQTVVEVLALIILTRATIARDHPFITGEREFFGMVVSLAVLLVILLAGIHVFQSLPPFGTPIFANMAQSPSQTYIEKGLTDTGAANLVAGVILDYRGYDIYALSWLIFNVFGVSIPGSWVLIAPGLLFNVFRWVGLVRFPDVYNRLPAATKCVTLGTVPLLVGVAVANDTGAVPENYIGPVVQAAPDVPLIVNTVDIGGPPGQTRLCTPEEIRGYISSTHALSLRLLIDLIRRDKTLHVRVIGIQASQTRLGECLSPAGWEAGSTVVDTLTECFQPGP